MFVPECNRVLRAVAIALLATSVAHAQDRVLQVVSTDSQPVSYAFVQANGGHAQLTDEVGRVNMGSGKKQTFTLDVRRIGYTPFYGKLDFPDTAVTIRVVLTKLAQQLSSVKVTSKKSATSLELSGFYKRWLDAQKGVTSAVFIGPEEIEKRNTTRVSILLTGVSGVTLTRTPNGSSVVTSGSGTCPMAIVVDGRQVCPNGGCLQNDPMKTGITEQSAVMIDQVIDIESVAGVEVYKRGGNMPSAFHVDGDCGVVALWTGSRKP
jgi:hypothetical protein